MAAMVKEAKGQIELRLARNIKTQRKASTASGKRLTKENMGPSLNRAGDSVTAVTDHSRSTPPLSFIIRKFCQTSELSDGA